jgi:hypothetical protein
MGFGPMSEEVKGGWRKSRDTGASLNIILVMKSSGISWSGV